MPASRFRRAATIVVALWFFATIARLSLHSSHGLRGQYFTTQALAGSPAFTVKDAEISSAGVFRRWRAAPPAIFSVQWSGYLQVLRSGAYRFESTSDQESRLYVDRQLVLANVSGSEVASRSGTLELASGSHAILLQYVHAGGQPIIEWSWARGSAPLVPVPDWVLSTTPRPWAAIAGWGLPWIWWVLGGVALGFVIALVTASSGFHTFRQPVWLAARMLLLAGLAALFFIAASEHATRVNTSKARGDQSGYLWDAEQVYANWSGRTPPSLIGGRARMPLYASYLALFYTPRQTDAEFFLLAKAWNIRLALGLLLALSVIFAWHLPPLLSTNLSLIVAFGYFVFKAGYAQPELLFYFLFFVCFLACWHLFREEDGVTNVCWGALAGGMAGLAYLTKALVPPFVAVFLFVYASRAIVARADSWGVAPTQDGGSRIANGQTTRQKAVARFWWRVAAAVVMSLSFLVVVYPYISNSKRLLGGYFYNLNTSHYIWYDTGSIAMVATMANTDQDGRILLPQEQLPTFRTYWASHTVGQIIERLNEGFADMVARSYAAYGYLKYLVLYAGFALILVATNPGAAATLARQRWALLLFLLAYAAVYLAGTAFFVPISGTGSMRFLLAHAAPLFFALSRFFARAPFSTSVWSIGRVRLTPTHFHVFVLGIIGLELTFTLWRRLMTTYGGF